METRNVFGLEREVRETLATAKYRIYGIGHNGEIVDEVVRAELSVSGASQYGNGTCMAFLWENGNVDSFDTRYEKVTPEHFEWFAKDALKNYVMKTISVYAIHCDAELEQDRKVEAAYTGKHHVGEIVHHGKHECRVTRCWDCGDGNGISIVPTGDYGFEVDVCPEERL